MITAIGDPSEVGEARRAAAEFARKSGANEQQLGRIAIVVTELATNIVKHAGPGGGMLIVDRHSDAAGAGVELLAIDKGPGMADVKACLADGFSTAGSPGTGLGAIERQADKFAVYSRPGLGTAISARVSFGPSDPTAAATDVGIVTAVYPGETVCGDKWAFGGGSSGRTLLIVDGSGHGPAAARAAETATKIFDDYPSEDCVRAGRADASRPRADARRGIGHRADRRRRTARPLCRGRQYRRCDRHGWGNPADGVE